MPLRNRQDQLQSIVQEYGLRLVNAKPCRSFYKNAAAYRAETDRGIVLIKPFVGTRYLLNNTVANIQRLSRSGFEHMPKWLKTKAGRYWTHRNGRLYYASEWISGSNLLDHLSDYRKIGEVLSKLHKVSNGSHSTALSPTRLLNQRFKQQYNLFRLGLPKLEKELTREGNWFKDHGRDCIRLSEESWKVLNSSHLKKILQKEKKVLVHGDITRPNIIINANRLYLVDWDRLGPGSIYFEIVKALSNTTDFSIPKMDALLSGYQSKHSLSRAEKLLISSIFRFPREAWYAAYQIRLGRKSSLFQVVQNTWPQRLKAIEWLDSWARKKT